jgi:hypothetical protein
VVAVGRKTKEGKAEKKEAELKRLKEKALFKATLKKADDSADDWDDVEEDFPHVKLEELLDNLKIDDHGLDEDEA